MRKLLILIVIFTALNSFGQEAIENRVFPAEILEEAGLLLEVDDPEKALQVLSGINENDTLYPDVVKMKIHILGILERYAGIISLVQEELDKDRGDPLYLKKQMANAWINQEENEKAILIYDALLRDYPYNSLVYHSKAGALNNQEKHKEAIQAYQYAVALDCYNPAPHLQLGLYCYNEGLISQALLCFNTYLLLNNTSDNALDLLVLMDEMVSSKPDIEPHGITVSPDDKVFKDADLILRNYAALSKKYKTGNPIDLALVKQNHALFEMLGDIESTEGFWSGLYVPFYHKLMKEGHFDNFIFRILRSTTNEGFTKIIDKNSKDQEEFVKWVADEWREQVRKAGEKLFETDQSILYYATGELNALASLNQASEIDGYGKYYFREGNLLSEGTMRNGLYQGTWKFYHPDGKISQIKEFRNDTLDGPFEYYYPNGKQEMEGEFSDGYFNGEIRSYNMLGAIREIENYEEGTLDGGYKDFYGMGEGFPEYVFNYEDGVIRGKVLQYHPSGEVKMEVNAVDGQKDGVEKGYFEDGILSSESNYKVGILEGDFRSWHRNKQLAIEGQYSEGKPQGEWKEYYPDGTLSEHYFQNEKGELEGEYRDYDKEGNLNTRIVYKRDKVQGYESYGSGGEVISRETKQRGRIQIDFRYTNGNPKTRGEYIIDGAKDGKWMYFSEYGNKETEEDYIEGSLQGQQRSFYADGSLKSVTTFEDNQMDGPYREYYPDGTVKQKGYYLKDQPDGLWTDHYADGDISTAYYYVDGERRGYAYNYGPEGRIFWREYYKDGWLMNTVYYDTAGTPAEEVDLTNGDTLVRTYFDGSPFEAQGARYGFMHGDYISYYPNGQIRNKGSFFNADVHGEWEYYYENGQMSAKGSYLFGLSHGEWQGWHEDGTLYSSNTYEFGSKTGEQRLYQKNGELSNIYNYRFGELHGESRFFSYHGKLQMIRYYRHGELIGYSYPGPDGDPVEMIPLPEGSGEVTTYFTNGKPARKFTFLHGEFQGEYLEYFEDGSLREKQLMVAGERTGRYQVFYPGGQPEVDCNYLNGEMHGKCLTWYENGQLREQEQYDSGVLNGPAAYYNENGKLVKKAYYFNDFPVSVEYY